MADDEPKKNDVAKCVNCWSEIWYMGDYQGWIHAHSWASVCLAVSNDYRATPPTKRGE